MQPNPAAGQEPDSAQQFFFQNQRILQVGVLDNNGNHLLDEDRKIEGGKIKLNYKQLFLAKSFFFNNQTFCGNYDSNVYTDDIEWTGRDGECTTEYTFPGPFDQNYGTVKCTCSQVRNYYYSMLTDLTRTRVYPKNEQWVDHTIMMAILMPLTLIGLIFPCMMILLDSRDYQSVEDNVYPVDDLTIAQLERVTNRLCKQQIYYNEKEIARYLELNENEFRSGSCVAFSTFQRNLHPYTSLFTRFDYRSKRLTRFYIVLGQMSLITVLLWIAYSNGATTTLAELFGFEEEEWLSRRQLIISLALSLITIPLPDRCCCFFKTTMYLLNDESRAPDDHLQRVEEFYTGKKSGDDANKDTDADDQAEMLEGQKSGRKGEGEALVDQAEEEPLNLEKFVRPALYDQFLWCKVVGLVMIFLFWVMSIIMTVILMDISGKTYSSEEKSEDALKDFIFLTPE